ncbi:winged helix-turn-helix domain-containing protein [Paraburkholderia largidicola]|uniref:winged helix-turn-helix domain-containing protein n=1 Tax=Paraburkholderia largidicola TaxID=3014751 RepID=UPI0015DB5E90|nr:winged helix-turn-helix domain-containing protein [Paraburkholderia sp. PGU16]GJH35929.1 winged helix-turn-helix domain-containing protein [Paraburkholderia hospita]
MKVGKFQIEIGTRRLMLGSEDMNLGARAFDILVLIVAAGGQIVTRDELLTAVWRGAIVEDNNIDVHVCAIRKKLGSDRNLVITVPRRGYRFAVAENGTERVRTMPRKNEARVGAQGAHAQWEVAIDLLSQIMSSPGLKSHYAMRTGRARSRAARVVSAAASVASRLRRARSNLSRWRRRF